MRFIIFLDALDYDDVQAASEGWFKNLAKQYTPNVPRVTPNVISQIMTGKRREDLPFVRSTPYKKPRQMFIKGHTILHYATDKGLRVFQYGIPLCSQIELPKGNISTYDHFLGQQQVPAPLHFVQARKNFQKDDENNIFNAYVDEAVTLFASLRNIARNNPFNIMFLGYQPFDAYTHWYQEEHRRNLIKIVEAELQQIQYDLGAEILFFSDHGSTKKTVDFEINKWLKEKGWFDYKVYYKLHKFHQNPKNPYPNQMVITSPFVYINWEKTKFFCNDAFDAMIDATDKATQDDMKLLQEQLMKTGYFDSVALKKDIFDPKGEYYNDLPAVLPETSHGVNTTCNIHKDSTKSGSLENMRTGWHSKRGVVGCSDTEINIEVHEPADIYKMMQAFIDKEKPIDVPEIDPQEEAVLAKDLADLGYG